MTGRIYPVQVLFSQQSPATHHSRSEVPAPLWVDRLFEARSVGASAKLRKRQLLVPARDTQPAKGVEQHAGAVRGAESRHNHHGQRRHLRNRAKWLHLILSVVIKTCNCLHIVQYSRPISTAALFSKIKRRQTD